MDSKQPDRRRFLKSGVALAGLDVGAMHSVQGLAAEPELALFLLPRPFLHLALCKVCRIRGIGLLTVWFLLWMGLLQKLDLSFLYPFQGISPVLLVLAAVVFLKERADWRTWLGVALITAGTVLVAFTPPTSA